MAHKGEVRLPVIDLSVLNPSDLQGDKPSMSSPLLEELLDKIRDACQNWGFFQVINHGVEGEVCKRVDSVSRDLFSLPSEEKEKVASTNYYRGYTGPSEHSPYHESVSFSKVLLCESINRIATGLWADGNPQFCKAVEEYCSKVDMVGQTLIKLILMSLGDELLSEYYESFFEKKSSCNLRMNYYTSGNNYNNNQLTPIALTPHTDQSFITLLYHDYIEGLEIQSKEGDWYSVKPVSNSFSVNLGDLFQTWSNWRYRSSPHRVTYKGWNNRLSLVYFMEVGEEIELYTPPEMVDDDHPRRYRAFTFKEYKDYKMQFMRSRKSHSSSFDFPSPNPFEL